MKMVTEGEWGKVKKRYLTWLMQERGVEMRGEWRMLVVGPKEQRQRFALLCNERKKNLNLGYSTVVGWEEDYFGVW
jgi:hypothetical protein